MAGGIDIMNKGNRPTFVNAIREEVLDLNLASPAFAHKVKNRHVSTNASLSDHMHIRFDLEANELFFKRWLIFEYI